MTTRIPFPIAQWVERPDSGAAVALTRMAPYLTPAGYWVLLPFTVMPPAGFVQGAFTDPGGYAVLSTLTTDGLRLTRTPSSTVLIY